MTEPVKGKRAYTSAVRQEQAAQTRARIVGAADELFRAHGYARTTIRQVAEAAGVAVDTVYATFGTKVRVLTAVIDARLAPSGAANVLDRPEAQAVREAPDRRDQLRLLAADLAAVSTRVRPAYEILRTAAAVEPEVAAVQAEMDGHRLANMRRAVSWLRGPLRLEPDQAAQTLWALASPDVGRLLCDQLGWSETAHAAWLADVLERVLVADERRPQGDA